MLVHLLRLALAVVFACTGWHWLEVGCCSRASHPEQRCSVTLPCCTQRHDRRNDHQAAGATHVVGIWRQGHAYTLYRELTCYIQRTEGATFIYIQARTRKAESGNELLLAIGWAVVLERTAETARPAHTVPKQPPVTGMWGLANCSGSDSLHAQRFMREVGTPHLARSSS